MYVHCLQTNISLKCPFKHLIMLHNFNLVIKVLFGNVYDTIFCEQHIPVKCSLFRGAKLRPKATNTIKKIQ